MRLLTALLVISTISWAQSKAVPEDFEVTLERTGCLGHCPGYKITIHADGSVLYEGHYYVKSEGIRKSTISVPELHKLVERLLAENFFNWEEKDVVCVDFPEVHITVAMDGRRKDVLEGCNEPGNVLKLANYIDRISGSKRWVGKVH